MSDSGRVPSEVALHAIDLRHPCARGTKRRCATCEPCRAWTRETLTYWHGLQNERREAKRLAWERSGRRLAEMIANA